MSHATRTLWMLALVFFVAPGSQALPAVIFGDAGTTTDAGGTEADAMPLAYGSYAGNLTPTDADWYVFPAPESGACVNVTLVSQTAMQPHVTTESGHSVTGDLHNGSFSTVIAVESTPVRLGVLPDDAPFDIISAGPYAFSVDAQAPSLVGDRRHGDAGSTPATATPVPGDCFSGHLRSDGPDTDVFAFAVEPGDLGVASLATGDDATGQLRVIDASGRTIAGPIPAGDSLQLTFSSAGTHYLEVVGTPFGESALYTVALVVGPPTQGCRPACISM